MKFCFCNSMFSCKKYQIFNPWMSLVRSTCQCPLRDSSFFFVYKNRAGYKHQKQLKGSKLIGSYFFITNFWRWLGNFLYNKQNNTWMVRVGNTNLFLMLTRISRLIFDINFTLPCNHVLIILYIGWFCSIPIHMRIQKEWFFFNTHTYRI